MNPDLAITVENMSKLYRLGVERQSDDNMSTAIASIEWIRIPNTPSFALRPARSRWSAILYAN